MPSGFLGHPRAVERGHLVEDQRGCPDHVQGEECTGPLTQAHAQVEHRLEAQVLESDCGARLGRQVAGDAPVCDCGIVRRRGEEGGAGDDAPSTIAGTRFAAPSRM